MLRLDRFARYPLTFGPTPIEFLPRLTAALGGQVEIWAKRDDCNSGLALERQALLEVPIGAVWSAGRSYSGSVDRGGARPSPIAVLLPGSQTGAVRTDQPDEDAYGRVTNPERFQAVADAASAIVGELVDTFDVEAAVGSTAVDFPNSPDGSTETILLVPSVGTPLAILITDFPGVLVRFGAWGREAFPGCGCDACDEQPPDVIERMHKLVEAAVEGRYEEELTKRTLAYSFTGAWGRESSEGRLERGERKRHGELGAHSWPPWPRRKRS